MKLKYWITGIATATLMLSAEQLPGKHPYYLHALTDLRTARWCLTHQPGDERISEKEDLAINEIDASFRELKVASIDDGKNLNDHPAVDVKETGSRLLRAIELLKKAHADVAKEEDDPAAKGLRNRAIGHLDAAIHAAESAHATWIREKEPAAKAKIEIKIKG